MSSQMVPRLIIGTASMVTAMIALLALIGHLGHITALFIWPGEGDGMPVNSAICILLLGLSMYRVALTLPLKRD